VILNRVIFGNIRISDIILSFAIILIASLLAKVTAFYLRKNLKGRVDENNLKIIVRILNYSVFVLSLLMILPHLGLNLSGLLVAGGMTGLVIGFASQKVVSNLISGVFLMIEKPIRIGQGVNIEGTVGVVVDINIMSTIIRTYESLYVRIPNEKVFTNTITNFVENIVRRINYTVGIRYSDDAEKAIDIIKNVLEYQPFVLENPKPMIFVDELGDNAVNIVVRFWAPTSEWFDVKTRMLWEIKKAIESEGIQVPFPQRTVWFASDLSLSKEQEKLSSSPPSPTIHE